ncbi:hypothetical protein, partial [Pedobacter jeongneungensis]|uniref:hypothetical protein n=1 Tax=Pedobacter jeongneungensis TaxID=947309 RepID=UPI00056A0419
TIAEIPTTYKILINIEITFNIFLFIKKTIIFTNNLTLYMKRKALNFDELGTFEHLQKSELLSVKGGEWEWGVDPNGNFYYRAVGSDTWVGFQTLEATASGSSNYSSISSTTHPTYGNVNMTPGLSGAGGGTGGYTGTYNPILGTTSTTLFGHTNTVFETALFDKLSTTVYSGVIMGEEGSAVTINTTLLNGKPSSYNLTIGSQTFSILTDWGIGMSNTSGNVITSTSISLAGITNGYATSQNGVVNGVDITFRPGGVTVGAALLIAFAPELAAWFAEVGAAPAYVPAF